MDVLFCISFERIFKFNTFKCSVSYENIDFVEGDGFEANMAKIWEKPSLFISFISSVCRVSRKRRPKTKDLETEDPLENEDLEKEDPLENEDLENEDPLENEDLEKEDPLENEDLENEDPLENEDLENEDPLENEDLENEGPPRKTRKHKTKN